MKLRASSGLQQSLLQPEVSSPPAAPRPQPVAPPQPQSLPRQEWWAAVQSPADATPAQLEALAQRAQGFTPRVSLAPPDAVLLELRGCLRLFGGAEALSLALRAAFPASCRLAFAATPLAALVFARCAVAARLHPATGPAPGLISELAPLPLSALRWPEDTLRRLAAVGVRNIGAALRLPRAGFARRFGVQALETLDRLLGRRPDPQHAYAAPERFRRRCDPDVELTDQAAVLAMLAPVCAELETFLVKRQRGITSLALQLTHRGHAPTRQVLRLAAPAQRAAQLLSLLELQFGRAVLPAPVRRCELRSGPLLGIAADSQSLWRPGEHGGGGASAQMPSFLEQLRARLGRQAVSGLALASGHRPERLTLTPEPLSTATGAATRAARSLNATLPWKATRRPLWLLSAPSPLVEQEGWPCREERRLQLLAGPERVESGWWDGFDIERDYYQALDCAGARLWIFRERTAQQRWFLHGFFS
jgi:protein ImuB